jgi:hypothetical protein
VGTAAVGMASVDMASSSPPRAVRVLYLSGAPGGWQGL